jgi:hypothetical protein
MPSAIESLLQEYIRRRQGGQTSPQAIEALRSGIETLSNLQKQTFKLRVRNWEEEQIAAQATAPVQPRVPPFVEGPSVQQLLIEARLAPLGSEIVELICQFCGRANRAGEKICAACGRRLAAPHQPGVQTRILRQTNRLSYSDEFFGDDFVLSLRVRGDSPSDQGTVYEVRPQQAKRPVIIGRQSPDQATAPDVDLSAHDAAARGVSRAHVSLVYDPESHVIRIEDQGSANGTFINGQRLHRREVRVLRHGDEVRLGALVLQVKFFTYDFGL